MALPNVTINMANGGLGRVDLGDDGVAGLLVTGAAVAGKLELNRVYQLGSVRDVAKLGITQQNNPLAYKELMAFYTQTGDGAELYLLVVADATLLTQMCAMDDASPLRKLITHAQGRIRLVGINRLPPAEYTADTTTTGIDKDAVTASEAAHAVGENFAQKMMPFRCLIPAAGWDGKTDKLYKPREASHNRVEFIMACDDPINRTAAIGQVLGRAAKYPVNYSTGRVKSGAIATEGWLTNGKTPAECAVLLDQLDAAGYVIYRKFPKKSGVYLNDDPMAAPLSDDYSNLSYARIADKAMLIIYATYVEQINDDIETDDDGYIPAPMCTYYEGLLKDAVGAGMQGEISAFTPYVNPKQNVLSLRRVEVKSRIRPRGMVRDMDVDLGFENPALKQ